ncbi:hypothetical protein P7996_15725, partial [Staphylococcus aureus]|nr:hypothetical protein [Staphylococcus aureus]
KLFVEVLGMNSFSVNLPWTTPGPLGIIMGTGFGLWSFVLAITYANIEANFKLLQAGEHADKIITSGTQMFIVTFGGTGATLV